MEGNVPGEMIMMRRRSAVENERRNLKALDLISFWWTKPKKLTPELKEIMFGNIYDSPFARYYLFLLKQAQNHPTATRSRSLMALDA